MGRTWADLFHGSGSGWIFFQPSPVQLRSSLAGRWLPGCSVGNPAKCYFSAHLTSEPHGVTLIVT